MLQQSFSAGVSAMAVKANEASGRLGQEFQEQHVWHEVAMSKQLQGADALNQPGDGPRHGRKPATRSSSSGLTKEVKQAQKEQKRLERELEKARRAKEKAEQIALKEHNARIKVERDLQVISAKRNYLPMEYPSFEDSVSLEPLILPDGFTKVHDKYLYLNAIDELKANRKLDNILSNLCAIFLCGKREICLIERKTITRGGKRCDVAYVRYAFNPIFNDLLKQAGMAKFDQRMKSWNLAVDDGGLSILDGEIKRYFKVVIDIQSGSILQSLSGPELSIIYCKLIKLPLKFEVFSTDVMSVIAAKMVVDDSGLASLKVHNGQSFVDFPSCGSIHVRYDRLLLRYDAAGKASQYVTYCALTKSIVDVTLGNDGGMGKIIVSYVGDTVDDFVNFERRQFF